MKKLKYFDVDEAPGKLATIGAWIGGGIAVLGAIAGFVEGDIAPAIAVLIFGSLLFALGGALAGWIIGGIIKLVVKCLPKKEKPRFDTTEHFSWGPPSDEVIKPLVDKFMEDGGLKF
jgi:hypothetical protein